MAASGAGRKPARELAVHTTRPDLTEKLPPLEAEATFGPLPRLPRVRPSTSLPLLLGEAPSLRGDRFHHFPLSGPPARVLCKAAEIPPVAGTVYGRWTWALYDAFECVNLFERYRDATPWRTARARSRVAEIGLPPAGVLVCLGRRVLVAVASHLDVAPLLFHEWVRIGDLYVVATPHPSGRNRLLNDRAERERLRETLVNARLLAELL